MTDLVVPEIGFWCIIRRNQPKNGFFKRQVEQGFSSFFCQLFGIFDDFLKWMWSTKELLEKASNMPKIWFNNEEKPRLTNAFHKFYGKKF